MLINIITSTPTDYGIKFQNKSKSSEEIRLFLNRIVIRQCEIFEDSHLAPDLVLVNQTWFFFIQEYLRTLPNNNNMNCLYTACGSLRFRIGITKTFVLGYNE